MEHAPPLTRGEKQLKVVLYTVISVIATATVISAIITGLFAYPFSPYAVDDAKVRPLEVCPDDEIMVDIYSEVQAGWKIERVEIVSEWVDVNDPSRPPIPAGSGTVLEPTPHPFDWRTSNVTRFAPFRAGEFRLLTRATVYGTYNERNAFSGFPRSDEIEYKTSDVIVVGEQCEGVTA